MPRKARIDAPGALHHIIVRGIEKSPIFKDSRDHEQFLARLGTILTETSTVCYAWALIPNHVHLLLRTGTTSLTTVMRRVLTGYAQQFNRRHRRHGYLFQNRYKSILCETDPYLLELVRYIHLNPVRARKVADLDALDRYPHSGHAVLMGNLKHPWQDTDTILSLFGRKSAAARRAYRSFVERGMTQGKRPELVGGDLRRSAQGWTATRKGALRGASDERILGSSAFVTSVLEQAREAYDKRLRASSMDLATLVAVVADRFDVAASVIKSTVKQRPASQARAILAHLAIDRLGITGTTLAEHLHISPSAVSKLAGRGRRDPLSPKIEAALFASKEKDRR